MSVDYKAIMQQGRDFIAANLADCCREELGWQNTALLRDGKLREAAEIYAQVDASHAIPLAQSETMRQAMQAIAAQGEALSQQAASDYTTLIAKEAFQQGRAAGIEEAAKWLRANGLHRYRHIDVEAAIRALAAKSGEGEL